MLYEQAQSRCLVLERPANEAADDSPNRANEPLSNGRGHMDSAWNCGSESLEIGGNKSPPSDNRLQSLDVLEIEKRLGRHKNDRKSNGCNITRRLIIIFFDLSGFFSKNDPKNDQITQIDSLGCSVTSAEYHVGMI